DGQHPAATSARRWIGAASASAPAPRVRTATERGFTTLAGGCAWQAALSGIVRPPIPLWARQRALFHGYWTAPRSKRAFDRAPAASYTPTDTNSNAYVRV